MKNLLIFCGCFLVSIAFADKPVGFLWYNLPNEESSPKAHRGIPYQKLSYTDKDAVLRFYTLEALHKVRFTHRLEDERRFLALQSFWLREASFHGELNQRALRYYPEYDFSVTHPSSNVGTKLTDTFDTLKIKLALRTVAKTHGLLFFYRGQNAFDRAQIPILLHFCKAHHFSLLPVSIDKTIAPELPNSRLDEGQAKRLNINFFPAMFLVKPKAHITTPIAFGLTTQDVLTERLMAIVWRASP